MIRALALVAILAGQAAAEGLFEPTPPERMRDLSTDRPDTTESPYTVDAGHFQLEMDLVNWSRDDRREEGERVRERALELASLNLKAGLTGSSDLQFVFSPFVSQKLETAAGDDDESGASPITLRLKLNMWGNDGGDTAFAFMPFVTFPSASDELGPERFEGGLIAPLAISLNERLTLSLMAEADILEDSDRSSSALEILNTASLGVAVTDSLGSFVEIASFSPVSSNGDWRGFFDFGFTYLLTANLQLDSGMNVGLNEAATDYNPFFGMSCRY